MKLSFSKKFSRKILHTRKSALGVGLMKLPTIAVTIIMKLHLGCKRNSYRNKKTMGMNKENS